jgi:hypothetical protein
LRRAFSIRFLPCYFNPQSVVWAEPKTETTMSLRDLWSQFHSDYHLNFIVLSDHTSSGRPPRPIGRNFIQIIIWISLCSVTTLRAEGRPDLSVAISFRLLSEFHFAQWPHFGTFGRNFIQIIIWISLCSVTTLRDPWSQFHSDYHLNFIVLSDHTSSGRPPRPIGRNFIQIIIWNSLCSVTTLRAERRPDLSVAISFRLSSKFHCAQWPHFGTFGRNFIQIIIWISLCSVTALLSITQTLESGFHEVF